MKGIKPFSCFGRPGLRFYEVSGCFTVKQNLNMLWHKPDFYDLPQEVGVL